MDRDQLLQLSRRQFLSRGTIGIGSATLAWMLDSAVGRTAAPRTGVMNPTPVIPKAKRIIYLTMAGGPSHLELFDYKPELANMNGRPMPKRFTEGQPIAQLQGAKELKCLGPQHPFRRWGESRQQIAEILPHTGGIADEICIIRSMVTEQINHDPAQTLMNTGTPISGRPSIGSWVTYGLGSENENLPGFVVLTSEGGGQGQPISARQWSSGFLPSRFQGVKFQSSGDPVIYVGNPPGVSCECQSAIVKCVKQINTELDAVVDDPEIATRIAQYELAFRMQSSVPELTEFSKEPDYIYDLYGTHGGDGTFASNCLLARRLAERGVRFIQLYHRGWDHHGGVRKGTETTAKMVDRATAALVLDLKQRGMLDETLIIWGGEFGRTPMAQGDGRDHHIKGFSIWMAGGGIKGGITHGATDEFGYNAVEDIVDVHDFHATLLHLLGMNHKKLTFRFQGRDFRLTDVAGNVVKEVLV
jgi:Protein of unknown function (DUF1501)